MEFNLETANHGWS